MWFWVAIAVVWFIIMLLDFGSNSEDKTNLIIKDVAILLAIGKVISMYNGIN